MVSSNRGRKLSPTDQKEEVKDYLMFHPQQDDLDKAKEQYGG